MLGVNQVAEAEVDRGLAHEKRIGIVRRSSGGGTIFADNGTLLWTVILPWHPASMDPGQVAREWIADPLCRVLSSLGIDAEPEGRNDVVACGKKIAGMAQYMKNGCLCTHASLLFETDLQLLDRLLTVDREKIAARALPSVRSRVENIGGLLRHRMGMQAFLDLLAAEAAELDQARPLRRRPLSAGEQADAEAVLAGKYASDDWNFGHAPPFSLRRKGRFPGGTLSLAVQVEQNRIAACAIQGDFLGLHPAQELAQRLEGLPFQRPAVSAFLSGMDLAPWLGAIRREELLSLLFSEAL